MALVPFSLLFLSAAVALLLTLSPLTQAQSPTAPAPSPAGPINITAMLEKGGQYTNFIRFLTQTTTLANQINNQVNNSNQGVTVFAPTDNAFNTLAPGTINNLTNDQQVRLAQYHVCPKYYSLDDFLTVSNPVPTQASGPDGRVYGLNFTGQGNQVNVSTGMVVTQVQTPFNQQIQVGKLALYSVEKVLIPHEFYDAPAPAKAPPPADTPTGNSNGNGTTNGGKAEAPSSGSRINVGLGLVAGVGLFCMGLLF